jgi:hypothetical protein
MKRVCPNPTRWNEVYQRLYDYGEKRACTPHVPPKPLILAGWAYTNDAEKMQRWEESISWATNNGCFDLLSDIPETDYYYVDEPTSYSVGPLGGPMYIRLFSHMRLIILISS